MRSSLFKPVSETSVVRGTNILTVVNSDGISSITPIQINAESVKLRAPHYIPHYEPDGVGATLVFHTESEVYVLGGIRNNPALEGKLTADNKAFPQQFIATIGGFLANKELPLMDAILQSIKVKMCLKNELGMNDKALEAQQTLQTLCNTIESNDGWEKSICIHTDRWANDDGSPGTMCYMTAIKHIQCRDSDLALIYEALQTIMKNNNTEGGYKNPLSGFEFLPLKSVIEKSLASHLKNDITKATEAYEKSGDTVSVIMNDLAMATLARNNAFQSKECAELVLISGNSYRVL